ncbi:MAG: AMP-binding protein [Clostridia bacterium]|nr:AMP-binding protein [Clostridia bacterium]
MKNDRPLHEKLEFPNIREMIRQCADMYGDKTAYSFRIKPSDKEAVTKSYNDLKNDVAALATELIARGYQGKHICLIGKLSYSWILVYYATMSIGSVLIPLDRDWQVADLADTVKRADTDLLIVDADIKDKGTEICEAVGLSSLLFIGGEENTLDSLIEAGSEKVAAGDDSLSLAPIDPMAMALLVFTSGTTGKGKGVMLSQKNILSDMAEVIPFIDFSVKCMAVLPPHHTYGSSVSILGQNSIGCHIYISSGIRYVSKELVLEKPGHICAVPLYLETFYRKLTAGIKDSGKESLVRFMMKLSNGLRKIGIDLRKPLFKSVLKNFGGELNMLISGGAPINQEIIDTFDALGINVLNGYGITECAPIIAVNHNYFKVAGSVGPILTIDEVKIVDPNEDGEGEIYVRGSNVMLGYYKDEKTTREAFDEEGFFKTGDYGKVERIKNTDVLFITGRKKNLIILSNGKNVYPEEIENELMSTPGLLEIIVYEGKSRRGDMYNAIVAEIYPDYDFMKKNGVEDVQKYFQEYVDKYNKTAVPYKKIAVLKVREEEFPKNTLRKILRFKLDMSID